MASLARLVDHAGVLLQIARRPTRRSEQMQQSFMNRRPFQQQREVAFAAQQRLQPLQKTLGCFLAGLAAFHPLRGAFHQPEQARTGLVTQAVDAGVAAPVRDLAGQ